MAAYAALVSLMNIMEQIQNHPLHSISFDEKQIESLLEKVGFLQDFLEGYSHNGTKEAEVLESKITSAAYAAEDVIESHVVDQILAGSAGDHGETSSISLLDLQKVIQDMDSVKEKVMKVKEEWGFKDLQPTCSMPSTSSRPLTTAKSTMVGFDDYLIQLMDTLTGQQPNQQIIPIVGMGGIGKTTLARNVYENLVIVQHFDICAWATVSQQYSMREILLELLYCQTKQEVNQDFVAFFNEADHKTNEELGEHLYKSLCGRRYLIILDDIWSIEVWDKIKFFFPKNDSKSRIVVTTRLSNVATRFGSSSLVINFLAEDKSWKLFCKHAFAQEGCPSKLEEIGKQIVKKCKGLPLAIVVIGGLLGKSYRTQEEYWETVAKDINSMLNSGEDDQCLNVLFLSYRHLPAHLKPCFLYVGVFPEDDEIRVSRLIKLWVAEGFIKPNKSQSLEDIAEGYLKDLVGRNLILVRRLGSNGKIKTCSIHDLLREICLRVAKKENFVSAMRVLDIPRGIYRDQRRIVIHGSIPEEEYDHEVFHALQSASLARSLICMEGPIWTLTFRLMRVLNVVDSLFLEIIFQQVNLRYLACNPIFMRFINAYSELPSSISLLWNLQTLIIRGSSKRIVAPSEIWEMPQIRHIEFNEICLPDPLSNQQDPLILKNLQTLLNVVNFRWSEEVCKRIPNIKKLKIYYDYFPGNCEAMSYYYLYNLGRLYTLDSLNCSFYRKPNWGDLLQNITFSSSLQKLSLINCNLHWEDLSMIGSLPDLEVLKLGWKSITGTDWNPVEGEFLRLKFLKIDGCGDLIYWNANRYHFPILENLVLRQLLELDEIPSGIGEILTLRVIHLDYCSESAAISAVRILEEQENLGNEGLQVRVKFSCKKDLESFRENVELVSLTSNNLQLEASNW